MAQLTNLQIISAMRDRFGNRTYAAEDLGISRQALSRRIASNRALKAALEDIHQMVNDLLEARVKKAALSGDIPAAMWLLERLAKDRGYSLRTEHTGRDGGAIDLNTLMNGLSDDQLAALERFIATGGSEPARS